MRPPPDIVIGGRWFRYGGRRKRGTSHVFAPEWSTARQGRRRDVNGDGRPDVIVAPAELQRGALYPNFVVRSAGGESAPRGG